MKKKKLGKEKEIVKKTKKEERRQKPKEAFTTENLIQKLMEDKGYQAREARMIVRDVLEILDEPIIESKDIVFRSHFFLKKKQLSTRFVASPIMRMNNPTMPLSDRIIVARRTTYKFVPSSKLKKQINKHKTLKDEDFKVMLSDQT